MRHGEIHWEGMARVAGWKWVAQDPRGYDNGIPCLYHAEQERSWPLGDWEGAARDLGLDKGDDCLA